MRPNSATFRGEDRTAGPAVSPCIARIELRDDHGPKRPGGTETTPSMRIMIDGMNLALEQGTGVATYARNLVTCLQREGHEVSILYGRNVTRHRSPLLREVAFFNATENRARSRLQIGIDLARSLRPVRPYAVPETNQVIRTELSARFPRSGALLNHRSLFNIALSKFEAGLGFLEVDPPEPVDVAHWTYPMPLRARGARNVYTIHDMVPLKLPFATLDSKARHFRLLRAIARHGDAVATVSDTSRDDILAMLPEPPALVVNTHQSVSIPPALMAADDGDLAAEIASVSESLAAQAPPGLAPRRLAPRAFYLFVGAIEPKKNLRRLIEAYQAAGVSEPLVVVGRRAWQFKDTETLMARTPGALYLDYLPFRQVVALMRTARATLFPSLYEGFGLPVLESFLCGTPVVTSAHGATAEIAGDAALLVDPYDVGDIRDAIRRLSASDSESLRTEMAARGLARAAAFDEARIAPRLTALYREVIGGKDAA